MVSVLLVKGLITVAILALLFTGATHLFWPGKVKTTMVFPVWAIIIDGAATGFALTLLMALLTIIGGSAILLLRRDDVRRMLVRK